MFCDHSDGVMLAVDAIVLIQAEIRHRTTHCLLAAVTALAYNRDRLRNGP